MKKFTYVIRAQYELWPTRFSKALVKIGQADDPARRLAALRTANPYELKLACVFPNEGLTAERALHEKYARYQREGEWFKLPPVVFLELAGKADAGTDRPGSFRHWLAQASSHNDPVGDLAHDAFSDGGSNWVGDTLKSLRDNMREHDACRMAVEAWQQAVREFLGRDSGLVAQWVRFRPSAACQFVCTRAVAKTGVSGSVG